MRNSRHRRILTCVLALWVIACAAFDASLHGHHHGGLYCCEDHATEEANPTCHSHSHAEHTGGSHASHHPCHAPPIAKGADLGRPGSSRTQRCAALAIQSEQESSNHPDDCAVCRHLASSALLMRLDQVPLATQATGSTWIGEERTRLPLRVGLALIRGPPSFAV